MTNLTENLKDQQIQRQADEIESQRRKIESLEAELQKCLDPDSGEINPSLRGEKALLAKIQILQKQLDDCLKVNPNPEKGIIRTEASEDTLAMACAAPFMPKIVTKKDGGFSFPPKAFEWQQLQRTLLEWEGLRDYWPTEVFRDALKHLNYIVNGMAIQEIHNLKVEQYTEEAEAIGRHFSAADAEDHAACLLLKEMVEKIKADDEIWQPNIDDILVSLSVIIQCQAIYLSLQDEPEKEEEKEEPASHDS